MGRWCIAGIALLAAAAPAAAGPEKYLARGADWYRGEEAAGIAANVLSYQSPEGSWPKNIDTTAAAYAGEATRLRGTFDNGATTGELRFLARMRQATADQKYERAFLKGLDHVLKAQYPTGGWPQYYPPPKTYHRHITFNDDAMVRLVGLLRDVAEQDHYAFVDAARRKAAKAAYDRGVQCILKCQIRVDGKLTAWCAQHDELDYHPRPGRRFELVSLSGAESVGIVRLLMSLDDPSPDVVRAVEGAVAWFESAKVEGIRVVLEADATAPRGRNKVVVKDAKAPTVWARFYEIETNKPIFADRDGVKKYALADIGMERRNGYAWYGNWPQPLLEKDYPVWKKKWVEKK